MGSIVNFLEPMTYHICPVSGETRTREWEGSFSLWSLAPLYLDVYLISFSLHRLALSVL